MQEHEPDGLPVGPHERQKRFARASGSAPYETEDPEVEALAPVTPRRSTSVVIGAIVAIALATIAIIILLQPTDPQVNDSAVQTNDGGVTQQPGYGTSTDSSTTDGSTTDGSTQGAADGSTPGTTGSTAPGTTGESTTGTTQGE